MDGGVGIGIAELLSRERVARTRRLGLAGEPD
jgi:hypothetical protein